MNQVLDLLNQVAVRFGIRKPRHERSRGFSSQTISTLRKQYLIGDKRLATYRDVKDVLLYICSLPTGFNRDDWALAGDAVLKLRELMTSVGSSEEDLIFQEVAPGGIAHQRISGDQRLGDLLALFESMAPLTTGTPSGEAGQALAPNPVAESVQQKEVAKEGDSEFSIDEDDAVHWHTPLMNMPTITRSTERTEYNPVDINRAFKDGYLYYPTETLFRTREEPRGKPTFVAEAVETVVIRSDRKILRACPSPTSDGVHAGSDVVRLSDGTLIERLPKANPYGSWKWSWIAKYLQGEAPQRDMATVLYTLHRHLRARTWLAREDDYWLLTLSAAASYAQSIFESVPIIFLNGPAGTGKSETGQAMVEASANAVMIGQTSYAGMSRLIDESGGLIVIDDLESISKRGTISDMAQIIKIGYKKSTATRVVTDPRTQRSSRLNSFGIKVISNTMGADDILGSRMLTVFTRKLPEQAKAEFVRRPKVDPEELELCKNALHHIVFDSVAAIHAAYMEIMSKKGERTDEIIAPLMTMAVAAGDEKIITYAEDMAARQRALKVTAPPSGDPLKEACRNLIAMGVPRPFIFLVRNEIAALLEYSDVCSSAATLEQDRKSHRLLIESPEYLGRELRALGLIHEGGGRKRLFGKNLRWVSIETTAFPEMNFESGETGEPDVYCKGRACVDCKYLALGCEVAAARI